MKPRMDFIIIITALVCCTYMYVTESVESMASLLSYDPRQLTGRRSGLGNLTPSTPTLTALLSPSSKKIVR